MITQDHGSYILTCDNCEMEADERFDSFSEATEWRKDNGWKVQKNKQGEWENLCPDCQN